MRRLNEAEPLGATVNEDGEVLVEGEFVGRLQGFQFMADPRATGVHGRAVRAAAMKGLSPEMQRRADLLAECGNEAIHLTEHGRLIWQGAVIARLMPKEPLKPRIEILASDLLEGEARVKARNRLERWLTDHIEHVLSPLFKLTRAEDITGLSRGLAFRLVENFGAIARSEIAGELAALDQPARAQLRRYGVRFGAFSVFLPLLIKPAPAGLLAILRALWEFGPKGLAELPALPAAGLTSLPTDSAMPANIYAALGYYLCGERAVRRDMLERLADLIRETMKKGSPRGGFESSVEMMSLMGASPEGLAKILASLGFRAQKEKRPASQKNAKIESAIGVSTQDTPQTEPEIGVDQQNADEPDKLAACVDASVPELLPQEGEELIEIWRPARTKPAAHVLPRSLPQGENDGHFGPRKRGSGRKDRKYVKDKGEDARRGPPCSGAGPLPAHHVNEAADQVTSKPERQRRKPAGTPKDRAAHRFASASRDRQDISDSPFAVLRHMFDGGETQSSERGRKRK
jgi:ATP-dependent RNA helicase SUPV3L1/SUV3